MNNIRGFSKTALIMLATSALLLFAGCSSMWSLSDKEAVDLLKAHYSFYNNGETVEAEVLERGEFNEECDCYPVRFKVAYESGRHNHKTFYFYKEEGRIEVRRFFGKSTY